MLEDLQAKDSLAKAAALQQLSSAISTGEKAQAALIERLLKVTIRDKLVDPRFMRFVHEGKKLLIQYETVDGISETVTVDPHALGHLAKIAEIHKPYVNALVEGCASIPEVIRLDLLCTILHVHFKQGVYTDRSGNRTKHLHRIVGNELLGVLSRTYNRKLGTAAMLRPFLEQCAVYQAKPAYARADRLHAMIQCVLPIVFEPVKGEFVAFGANYSNSDYGSGSLLVRGVLLRTSTSSITVLEDKLRKIHLGAVISDEEIELSAATLEKESATHISAVRDMVKHTFSRKNIEQSLELIKYAVEKKLRWQDLMAKTKDILNKAEQNSLEELLKGTHEGVTDLPPVTVDKSGDPEANAWWAAAALGVIATRTDLIEHKLDIQELAGRLLK